MSSKKLCVLLFSVVLLMVVPVSADGAFNPYSCVEKNGKAKMIKNSDDDKKIYCVSLKTAEVLEDRGWGINFGDSRYFLEGISYQRTCFPESCIGRASNSVKIMDFEKDKEKFHEWLSWCNDIFYYKSVNGTRDIFSCTATFYNSTYWILVPLNPDHPKPDGVWMNSHTALEIDPFTGKPKEFME